MTSEQIISAERKKERLIKVYSSLLDEIEEKNFHSWKFTIPIKK